MNAKGSQPTEAVPDGNEGGSPNVGVPDAISTRQNCALAKAKARARTTAASTPPPATATATTAATSVAAPAPATLQADDDDGDDDHDGCQNNTALISVLREYLAGVPLRSATVNMASLPKTADSEHLVSKVFRHPVTITCPPDPRHTLSWAKRAVKSYAAAGHDEEPLYEVIGDAVSTSVTEWGHIAFCPFEDTVASVDPSQWVVVKVSTLMCSGGTTGLSSWSAASTLSEWACANKSRFEHKSVVELGCGPGLAGLVVALGCSPKSVVLTDGTPAVLDLATENVRLNTTRWRAREAHQSCAVSTHSHEGSAMLGEGHDDHFQSLVTVEGLDWTLRSAPPLADVIIAADVVFDPSLVEPLADVLAAGLCRESTTPGGPPPVAFVAHTERNPETWASFVAAIQARGLTHKTLAPILPTRFPRDIVGNTVHILEITA